MNSTHNENPESPENPQYHLPPQEAAYADALLEQGLTDSTGAELLATPGCPPHLAEIIHALAQLPPGEPPGDLVPRTIARARTHAPAPLRSAMTSRSMLTNTRRLGWTWDPRKADIAVMLLAACLLLTVTIFQLNKARVLAMQTACANNLALVGTAFGQYAASNNNLLPRIAIPADHDWLPRTMTPGIKRAANAHCNLANLTPMLGTRTHYTAWDRMICPAAGTATIRDSDGQVVWSKIDYSYIDELSAFHHHWGQGGHVAILADRNPLFAPGHIQYVNSNSWNHNRTGQNVLFDDGSVYWTRSPDVGPAHDNIWTIGSPPIKKYSGLEEPASPQDIILVP
jgi:hypothetical protein